MNLKIRLLMQNIIVLIATIIITIGTSVIFSYIYCEIHKMPMANSIENIKLIVLKNDEILYQSHDFSKVQIKEILMNISLHKNIFDDKNKKYDILVDEFKEKDEMFKIIKLNSSVHIEKNYIILARFIIVVFLITFIISSYIMQRYNTKHIINPIIKLKKETEELSNGELDREIIDEGRDEILDLSRAVEQLRLRLKDSLYYKEKYDENRKFLISSISHDLKTPITSARGYIEGVLDGIANTPYKEELYLKKAIDKIKLIDTMIEDLLLYSKLDLNQLNFDFEKINILEYIKYSVEDNLIEFEKENKIISTENKLSEESFVLVDNKRFRRVVQNILDNAKKHIEQDKGKLIIILRETNLSIIIEFKDNGNGIKKEDLLNIFDRFYRADNARKIEGSSGLGLAIAKQIIEGFDGRIWAISEIDEGSSIIISLKKVDRI